MSSVPTYRTKQAPGVDRAAFGPLRTSNPRPEPVPRIQTRLISWLVSVLCAGLMLVGGTHRVAAQEGSWERQVERRIRDGQLNEAKALAEAMADDPESASSASRWLGQVSMAEARFEDAAQHFEHARSLGYDLAEIALPWSQALVKARRRADACELLHEASSAEPGLGDLHFRAGVCFLKVGAPRRAMPHLESARKNGVKHVVSLIALATSQFGSGREDLAADLLAELADESSEPQTLIEVGKLLFQNVLYRQALKPLRKAWEAKPGWYEAGMYLALAHYVLEEYEECVPILAALAYEARSAEYRYLLGSVLAQRDRPEEARQAFDAGISLAPQSADGYLNLGLFLLDQGQLDAALEVFERGAARVSRGAKIIYRPHERTNCSGLAPPTGQHEGDPVRARYFISLADTLLTGQQWKGALEVYLAALQIDPMAVRPYGGIGLVCQELGTAEVGLAFAMRGVELHPENPELRYYLGSLHEYLSQPAAAIESYQTALRLGGSEPSATRYWLRLGIVQNSVGEAAAAEESFRTALKRDSNFAEGHFRLGKLRVQEGNHAEAEKLFARAVRLDPSLTEAIYSWGLALVRVGKEAEGREVLEMHRKKAALRKSPAGGME